MADVWLLRRGGGSLEEAGVKKDHRNSGSSDGRLDTANQGSGNFRNAILHF
jgi:hypothetical protein